MVGNCSQVGSDALFVAERHYFLNTPRATIAHCPLPSGGVRFLRLYKYNVCVSVHYVALITATTAKVAARCCLVGQGTRMNTKRYMRKCSTTSL